MWALRKGGHLRFPMCCSMFAWIGGVHWICACDRLAFVDQGTSQDEVDRFAFSPKQSDGLPVVSYVGNRLAAFSLLVQQVHRKSWWCTFSSSFMEGRHVASSRGVGLERIYADRALGGHCNYCGFDCVTFAGGPGRAGSWRRAQCTNNLKQLGLSIQNYHTQTNALPAENMFLGPNLGNNGWGWNASWAVFMLPNLEQTPLYNAYNFSVNADNIINSTVTYTAVVSFSCPSDNQKTRPDTPWAPTNYVANHGGPGVIRMWSGTVVEFYTVAPPASTTYPVGTSWWGQGDSNLGFFGFESVVDGTSNTGLFSEKLLGWAIANSARCMRTARRDGGEFTPTPRSRPRTIR